MSYSISYGHKGKQNTPKNRPKMKLAVLILVGAAACLLWPQVGDTVRNLLFPWLDEPTVSAFSDMVTQIGEGTNVAEAFTAFCREIMSNAGILA